MAKHYFITQFIHPKTSTRMKKHLTALLFAALPAVLMAQDVEINATNFPDDTFRAIVDQYDTDGDGTLTTAEQQATAPFLIATSKLEKITTFDGIKLLKSVKSFQFKFADGTTPPATIDVSGMTSLQRLIIEDKTKSVQYVYADNCTALTKLELNFGYFTTVSMRGCTAYNGDFISRYSIKNLDLSGCSRMPRLYAPSINMETLLLSGCTGLYELEVSGNRLTELDLTDCENLYNLFSQYNHLTKLLLPDNFAENGEYCYCDNNHLTALVHIDPTLENEYNILTTQYVHTDLQIIEHEGKQKVCAEIFPYSASATAEEINLMPHTHSQILLGTFYHPELDYSAQLPTTADGGLKIIKTGTGDDTHFYIVVAEDVTKDIDLYGKRIHYKKANTVVNGKKQNTFILDFAEKAAGYEAGTVTESEYNKARTATHAVFDVTLTVYPYIMYVNPLSKDTEEGFYSGTIYLDYSAIIPDGCEAYIATGFRKAGTMLSDGTQTAADQLVLKKVAAAGQAVPANTPLYIKAATKEGLYAFTRNETETDWKWKYYYDWQRGTENPSFSNIRFNEIMYTSTPKQTTVTIPSGNILQGTLTDLSVSEKEVLTLGREDIQGTKKVGFWQFHGTTVPAHRVYIPLSTVQSKLGALSAPASRMGLTFAFEDDSATAINAATLPLTEANATGWYDLRGNLLQGRPTEKGLYIHNGRKVYVK